ncbi:hypothetical protein FNF27_06257 [Cafeteria roenbergensis]|uniref:Uncharacterized protein n=1 Tax=Cafeteria roenbergensis TaxID=33653 RepID=A0A5A8E6M6_CAFRO|nr:hypothetical protein FNF27_06257 [Cafeteria roenbergensis]
MGPSGRSDQAAPFSVGAACPWAAPVGAAAKAANGSGPSATSRLEVFSSARFQDVDRPCPIRSSAAASLRLSVDPTPRTTRDGPSPAGAPAPPP